MEDFLCSLKLPGRTTSSEIFRSLNIRITAFSTYLKLPRAVKMTVYLITKRCLLIRHYFVSQAFFDSCARPSDVLNYCKWDFNES